MTNKFMDAALEEAQSAAKRNEVPVGAVIVHDNVVIARAGNRTLELNDPVPTPRLLLSEMLVKH